MCMVMRRDNARRQGALWVIEIRLKLDMYVHTKHDRAQQNRMSHDYFQLFSPHPLSIPPKLILHV